VEVALVVLAALLVVSLWVATTESRLTRLGGRVETARAVLDAALVRRAAAVTALVDAAGDRISRADADRLRAACRAALEAGEPGRETAENDLGRAIDEHLPAECPADLLTDLDDASVRVVLARRFYNDGVRDTRALRGQRMTRALRLARDRPTPDFFEIADPTLHSTAQHSALHSPGGIQPTPPDTSTPAR